MAMVDSSPRAGSGPGQGSLPPHLAMAQQQHATEKTSPHRLFKTPTTGGYSATSLPSPLEEIASTSAGTSPTAAASPINTLFQALSEVFRSEREKGGLPIDSHLPADNLTRLDTAVRSLMHEYSAVANHQDWRRYAFFNDLHYVRNLIDANDDFELMVLCWAPGHASRVHNHGASHCWLTCLDGTMQEDRYVREPEDVVSPTKAAAVVDLPMPGIISSEAPCPVLQAKGSSTLNPGETGYINDHIALHTVRCPLSCPAPGGVTLHLYSPPIKRVTLYETETNRIVQRIPGFYSVRGNKC